MTDAAPCSPYSHSRHFSRSADGNALITFGLAAFAIATVGGAAVDYSKVAKLRTEMHGEPTARRPCGLDRSGSRSLMDWS